MQLRCAFAAIVAAFGLAAGSASATELIVNGGFEADTDSFNYNPTGWRIAERGITGAALVTDATASFVSGYDVPGAAAGSYYALLDSAYPSSLALSQSFTTGALSGATLSFSLFVADPLGYGFAGDGALDWEAETDVQWARVDLLEAGADDFATDAAVITSFYLGGATEGYQHYSFDLSAELAQGGRYTLRFAVAGNRAPLQLGVDEVSLNVTPVPEPESYAMLLTGLGLIGLMARRRA